VWRRQDRSRYADLYVTISPICEAFQPNVGITKTSAYSWLCRRRHNHDLRHTFGTTMIRKADIVRVQTWLGHADIETTRKYLHFVPRPDDARLRRRGPRGRSRHC